MSAMKSLVILSIEFLKERSAFNFVYWLLLFLCLGQNSSVIAGPRAAVGYVLEDVRDPFHVPLDYRLKYFYEFANGSPEAESLFGVTKNQTWTVSETIDKYGTNTSFPKFGDAIGKALLSISKSSNPTLFVLLDSHGNSGELADYHGNSIASYQEIIRVIHKRATQAGIPGENLTVNIFILACKSGSCSRNDPTLERIIADSRISFNIFSGTGESGTTTLPEFYQVLTHVRDHLQLLPKEVDKGLWDELIKRPMKVMFSLYSNNEFSVSLANPYAGEFNSDDLKAINENRRWFRKDGLKKVSAFIRFHWVYFQKPYAALLKVEPSANINEDMIETVSTTLKAKGSANNQCRKFLDM
ncbi:MAG: hypothetical protein IPJ71_03745 [Bdellovibrionales bacterium]|nr:hypothetical protein [Bdellovibrionales bacterium]